MRPTLIQVWVPIVLRDRATSEPLINATVQAADLDGTDAARKELDLRIVEAVEELAPREPAKAEVIPTAPMPAVATDSSNAAGEPPAETPVEVSFETHGPDPADTAAE